MPLLQCLHGLSFGATACLAKSTEARDVLHAIHLASRGLHVLPPATEDPGGAADLGPELLTARETEVLTLLAAGLSNAEIGKRLYLSHATVKTHINRIFAKTGARDRAQAVRYAYQHGLATPAQ